MSLSKKILQFEAPAGGEPICSGPEFNLEKNGSIFLSHFRTVVAVSNVRGKGKNAWFGGRSDALSLDCSVTINGQRYESQRFELSTDDIGKTLFCAGFPCITVTGLDDESHTVTVTISEIVDLCDPDSCPR